LLGNGAENFTIYFENKNYLSKLGSTLLTTNLTGDLNRYVYY